MIAENAHPRGHCPYSVCPPLGQEPRGLENGIGNRSGFDRVVHICTPTCVTRDSVRCRCRITSTEVRAPIARPDRALIARSRGLDKPCQYGRAPYLDRSRRIAHRFANQDPNERDSVETIAVILSDPALFPCYATSFQDREAAGRRGALSRDNIPDCLINFLRFGRRSQIRPSRFACRHARSKLSASAMPHNRHDFKQPTDR